MDHGDWLPNPLTVVPKHSVVLECTLHSRARWGHVLILARSPECRPVQPGELQSGGTDCSAGVPRSFKKERITKLS